MSYKKELAKRIGRANIEVIREDVSQGDTVLSASSLIGLELMARTCRNEDVARLNIAHDDTPRLPGSFNTRVGLATSYERATRGLFNTLSNTDSRQVMVDGRHYVINRPLPGRLGLYAVEEGNGLGDTETIVRRGDFSSFHNLVVGGIKLAKYIPEAGFSDPKVYQNLFDHCDRMGQSMQLFARHVLSLLED